MTSGARKIVIKRPLDIYLAIDVSRSMAARDYDPSRLEAAKQAAMHFTSTKIVRGHHEDRVGVLTFAKTPDMVKQLTSDLGEVELAISGISTFGRGSTSIGEVILLAKKLFSSEQRYAKQALILVTDGGHVAGTDPVSAASSRYSPHMPVFTVGIGGRVQESLLQNVAEISGAKISTDGGSESERYGYFHAPTFEGLREIYESMADL